AIKKLISDKDVQASLDEKFAMLSKLQKGNTSPDFSLQDIKGKTFSLSDFKGKVVYIDVWATWCGPCKAEMPFMKKIQEDLKGKDVAFIGICAWDKQENWKKYIEENKMQGTQLFAPDRALPFLKEYDIKGIPRFILLDKEGKIVEADAARPSDPQLKAKIESLL
ncbi:MAG TPA: TlpA disulfide reductase family protein, partial [Bacteroidia bacterium]|nr:TlpA disulfide reductase family protein [Bacteroidia bacterium]